MLTTFRAALMASTIAAAYLVPPQAMAQDAGQNSAQPTTPAPAPPQADAAPDIVVTGTLFQRTNTETPSPVTVLTSDTLAKAGITNVTDAVRSISADNSGSIPIGFSIGFANGGAGISLRGLTVVSVA